MVSIPVTDLKNTSATTALCLDSDEPVLVTKNGKPAFWLVRPDDMDRLTQAAQRDELYQAVNHSERQWREGRATDMASGLKAMRERYEL